MDKFNDLKQRIENTKSSFNNVKRIILNTLDPFTESRNYERLQHIENALHKAKADLLDAYLSDPHVAKMIAIAEVQSELMELDVTRATHNSKIWIGRGFYLHFNMNDVCLDDGESMAYIAYDYTSPTWQTDLINKVKELING